IEIGIVMTVLVIKHNVAPAPDTEGQPGLSLTYGQILALGGDFYGVPDEPIAEGEDPNERKQRFTAAYNSLAHGSADEVRKILDIMQREIDAVNEALKQGEPVSAVYKRLGDTLSEEWNKATGGGSAMSALIPLGRYLQLASVNWDHFGEWAIIAYQAGHAVALEQAVAARNTADPTQARAALVKAYVINAFADHYLSDLFSAGHLRDPRRQLYISAFQETRLFANLCARGMHDEDSHYGLRVSSAAGDTWRVYGDKRYFDTVNLENKAMVDRAVQASATEVFDAFYHPQRPPDSGSYAALRFIPDLRQAQDYRGNPLGNFSPMFVRDSETILLRRNFNDLNDHNWVSFLSYGLVAYDLNHSYVPKKPSGFIAPPASAPQIDPNSWQSNQEAPPDWVNGNQVRYRVSFEGDTFESVPGPASPYVTLQDNKFEPRLNGVPTGPAGVIARRIYRQFVDCPIVYVGRIDDNTTTVFFDTGGISVGGIKTKNGFYLTAAQNGGCGGANVPIRTDSRTVGEWEKFWLVPLQARNRFALRTAGGYYVTAVQGGGVTMHKGPPPPIQADRTSQGQWETFRFERQPDGTFAIRTSSGFYWTAVDGGGWGGPGNNEEDPIHTNLTRMGSWDWEAFTFEGNFPRWVGPPPITVGS
ncbi:MAG TPA: hypothetical protein VM782_02555, partial [Stellaceae bacterium]|nr:hypothetical protein [Stellaceae bacterium]